MSLLGKILIGLNLLAAGAFAYFTVQNWNAREALTNAAFVRDIQLHGLQVEAGTGLPDPGSGRVAMRRDVNNVPYESVKKRTLDEAIPKGDEIFGGATVTSQTDEVKRVKTSVFNHIAAQAGGNAATRAQWLRAYLLAIAVTGAERDGVNAIFDMLDPTRAPAARRDLPLVARTASQTAALRAVADITLLNDPNLGEVGRESRVAQAREAVKQFALGEVPFGAGAGDKAESERKLRNAILNAFNPGAGEAQKQAIISAAEGDNKGFGEIAAAAVEPLTDKGSIDRAAQALENYATAKQGTPAEAKALTAVSHLLNPPAGFNLAIEVDNAATQLLESKFDEAALPAASKSGAGDPVAAKARQIAHLLYHIDGWRFADKTPAVVTARQQWHQRVASIIGLPAYVRAAEAQATEYAEAAQRLVTVISEEQSAFEAEYQAKIQRVLFLYSQWLALDNQLNAQKAITDDNVRLMNERKTERDNLLQELAKSQADAKDALERLRKTQQDLFSIQKDLRDAQEALLVLEKELRRLELTEKTAGK
jgi:hypothetical protein